MTFRMIRKDISKSRLTSMVIVIFVAAAATLVALSAIVFANLFGAIDTLMEQSQIPHFLQMHSGEIDTPQLAAFAGNHVNVQEFQVLEFLNIDGSQITLGGNSLAGSVQDNGFSVQSEAFDFLMDTNGNVVNPKDGGLYVPLMYMRDGTTKPGDKADIAGELFIVAGFIRDSQMNSTLSSSKRFLVSKNDYAKLFERGNVEYLIEFRLNDLAGLGSFGADYVNAQMPSNGPTVTYPFFRIINGFQDGLMAGVILLVGLLIVAIAFLCIRFTLLAKIEEDYREIGVMKAIGLRVSDIRRIYLAKYAALSGCGAVLGFVLSLAFRGALLENIRLSMGESKYGSLALLFGGLGVALIFLAVVGYVSHVLKRFKRISASQAIRFGLASDKSGGPQSLRLSKNRLFPVNVFLGVKDVLTRKKLYVTMLVVLSLAMFIMIVPQNLYHTVAAKSFVNYMGIGDYDFRIDVQQTDDILAKIRAITETVKSDKDFSKFAVFITRGYSMQMENGSNGNIKVELGEHTIFPVAYAKGNAPRAANEIALSQVNADELEKTVGDEIILVVNGDGKPLTVCGVYSDFTNGGKTAKAAFLDDSPDITWAMICGELGDNSLVDGKVTEYASRYSFAKVSSVNEHIQQVFGGTLSAINTAAQIAIIAAIAVTLLVVILFMKMLAAKDRYEIAVMKSVGFTNGDVSRQYITRSFSVLIIGVLLGVILSGTLGEMLAGLAISAFNGGTAFNFTPNPAAYLFCVLTMAISAVIATLIGTSGTGKINLAQHIKE